MIQINVDIADTEYQVHIAKNLQQNIASFLKKNTKNTNILIVTDEYLESHYANDLQKILSETGFSAEMYVMKGGKASKTFNEVLKIYGVLETNDYARDSTLIALGGGVIGDLAGFVASTWYRGMNMIHIPTTLMGMVDSSIGGKVAINYRETINAVGNYYHPIANFMDINLIDTLPERDFISGLAEVVKCGLIADKALLDYLEKHNSDILNKDADKLVHCIKRAIEIKVDHVKNDVKEGGKRLLLNYGHTLGHAIEMATQTDKKEVLRHGEGVSIGISAALYLGESYLNLPENISGYARSLLQSLNLPTEISASELGYERELLIKKCMKLIQKDKKRKDNQLRFILLDELGHAATYTGINNDLITNAFEGVIKV
jgi:3-dehydroquinate synthase